MPAILMSSELYARFATNDRIDLTIYEAEEEFARTGEFVDANEAFVELEKERLSGEGE